MFGILNKAAAGALKVLLAYLVMAVLVIAGCIYLFLASGAGVLASVIGGGLVGTVASLLLARFIHLLT